MKKHILFSCLFALAATLSIQAQDPDQILEKHFKAMGQDNLLKVKTLKVTGKSITMGMEMPFTMMAKRPNKLKIVIDFQGMEIIQAYDGETAWVVSPMMGSSAPVDLTGMEADGMKESADLDGMLWKYEEKGNKIELGGTEMVKSREHYLLNLIRSNGNVDRYYIDKENYLLGKIVQKSMMNGVVMEMEVLPGDYRDVGGFLMPFTTEQRTGGQTNMTIKFDKIEKNVEIEDSIFSKTSVN